MSWECQNRTDASPLKNACLALQPRTATLDRLGNHRGCPTVSLFVKSRSLVGPCRGRPLCLPASPQPVLSESRRIDFSRASQLNVLDRAGTLDCTRLCRLNGSFGVRQSHNPQSDEKEHRRTQRTDDKDTTDPGRMRDNAANGRTEDVSQIAGRVVNRRGKTAPHSTLGNVLHQADRIRDDDYGTHEAR
jgi:hypothetical protein